MMAIMMTAVMVMIVVVLRHGHRLRSLVRPSRHYPSGVRPSREPETEPGRRGTCAAGALFDIVEEASRSGPRFIVGRREWGERCVQRLPRPARCSDRKKVEALRMAETLPALFFGHGNPMNALL